MLLIYNDSTNPAYNLAMEEYLLTRKREDIAMLWRNDNAVIIGRNQNAVEELNLEFIREKNVTVIRRMTGGGAVFHDLGNVNFTFIEPNQEDSFNNYARFTRPICGYLNTLGVDAQLSGRNDLTVEGMKISGNAQTVKNGRIMHHGTLLFSANMSDLAGALKPRPIKIESKGIKSIRSRVTNISAHLAAPMTVLEFLEGLKQYFLDTVPGISEYLLTSEDKAAADKLVEEKYGRWEWNYGQSPRYGFEKAKKFPAGLVEVKLEVENGVITAAKILGDFFGVNEVEGLEQRLIGIRHTGEDIRRALEPVDTQSFIYGVDKEDLAKLLSPEAEE